MCTDCSMVSSVKVHPFEAAGLGKAPYKFVGMFKRGSSCQYCGTGIEYQYHVLSSDGKRFYVGSDCIMKVDTGSLSREVAVEVKKQRAEQAKIRKEKQIVKKQLSTADQILKGTIPFGKHIGKNISDLAKTDMQYLMWTYKNITGGPVGDAFKTVLGPICQPVLDAMLKAEQEAKELKQNRDAKSGFVGNIGDKIQITAKLEIKILMSPICYGAIAPFLLSFRDENDNVYVAYYSGQEIFEREQTYTIKGTVKAHKVYKDIKQTQITRIKPVKGN